MPIRQIWRSQWLAAVIVLSAVGGLLASLHSKAGAQVAAAPAAAAVVALPDFAELVERTGPSVVNIRTTERMRAGASSGFPGTDEEMQEFFRRFFGVPIPSPRAPNRPAPRGGEERETPRGVGSGFILTQDGFIMTNHHVVDGADEIYVTLTDKREFKGKVIGSDQRTDVAVVKIEASGLPAVRIGDVNQLKVGAWVLAIGSPFGLDNTVTAGIVSAKQRDTGDFVPFIQTDVAVNPGNSGGPLINMRGEVVGINSQILSRTGTFAGVSFAIPIDEAMRVADQLRTSGRVTRGLIGVQIGDVGKELAESLGLAKAQGALVAAVSKDGPAEKAGIEAGDVILKFDGKSIDRSSELRRMAGNARPGTRVPVELWRKGKTLTVQVTLAEAEPDRSARRSERGSSAPKAEAPGNALGLAVSDLSEAQKRELRLKGGVVVETSEGAAARAGIGKGDIVLAVQDTDIADARQFEQVVRGLPKDRAVRLLVRSGEVSRWVIVRPGSGR
jgi:serine protease Do